MPRDPLEPVCRVIVLGSTGSIGTQTLDVIAHLNDLHARGRWGTRYDIVGLAAGSNENLLRVQASRFGVAHTALKSLAGDQPSMVRETATGPGGRVSAMLRVDAAEQLIRDVDCDLVIAAISGIAGLPATLAAVELGRDVALANKETLVAAGRIVIPAAERSGARLLPVDSEHSGVWQCLGGAGESLAPPFDAGPSVRRITLTASGGPFRTWTKDKIERATVEDALNHPTWSMGRKVTIDSATLMNKALEIIEAHWLFGIPGGRIGVLIHPQSIVHALVEFADGSVVSQMGAPDMRTPIQHALTWPRRAEGCSRPLRDTPKLEFEEPDRGRFPGLALAYRALEEGGSSGAVLNAANEVGVEAFLAGRIGIGRIAEVARGTMDRIRSRDVRTIEEVLDVDREARQLAQGLI